MLVPHDLFAATLGLAIGLRLVALKAVDHSIEAVRQIDHLVATGQCQAVTIVSVGHSQRRVVQFFDSHENPDVTAPIQRREERQHEYEATANQPQPPFVSIVRLPQCRVETALGVGQFLHDDLQASDIAQHRVQDRFAILSVVELPRPAL